MNWGTYNKMLKNTADMREHGRTGRHERRVRHHIGGHQGVGSGPPLGKDERKERQG